MSVDPNAKTWTEKGAGRKQCPACGIYHGVRRNACPACGHVHEKVKPEPRPVREKVVAPKPEPKAEVVVEAEDGLEPLHLGRMEGRAVGERPVIATPAGRCPVQISGSSLEEVREWAVQVRRVEEASGAFYLSNEALAYWLRRQMRGPELETALEHLESV